MTQVITKNTPVHLGVPAPICVWILLSTNIMLEGNEPVGIELETGAEGGVVDVGGGEAVDAGGGEAVDAGSAVDADNAADAGGAADADSAADTHVVAPSDAPEDASVVADVVAADDIVDAVLADVDGVDVEGVDIELDVDALDVDALDADVLDASIDASLDASLDAPLEPSALDSVDLDADMDMLMKPPLISPDAPQAVSSTATQMAPAVHALLSQSIAGYLAHAMHLQLTPETVALMVDSVGQTLDRLVSQLHLVTEVQRRHEPVLQDLWVSMRLLSRAADGNIASEKHALVETLEQHQRFVASDSDDARAWTELQRTHATLATLPQETDASDEEEFPQDDPLAVFFNNTHLHALAEYVNPPGADHRVLYEQLHGMQGYVPPWLPIFPPQYTYRATATFVDRLEDVRELTVRMVDESRLVQDALMGLLPHQPSLSDIEGVDGGGSELEMELGESTPMTAVDIVDLDVEPGPSTKGGKMSTAAVKPEAPAAGTPVVTVSAAPTPAAYSAAPTPAAYSTAPTPAALSTAPSPGVLLGVATPMLAPPTGIAGVASPAVASPVVPTFPAAPATPYGVPPGTVYHGQIPHQYVSQKGLVGTTPTPKAPAASAAPPPPVTYPFDVELYAARRIKSLAKHKAEREAREARQDTLMEEQDELLRALERVMSPYAFPPPPEAPLLDKTLAEFAEKEYHRIARYVVGRDRRKRVRLEAAAAHELQLAAEQAQATATGLQVYEQWSSDEE